MRHTSDKFFIDQFARLDCKLILGEPALNNAKLIKTFYSDKPLWIYGEGKKDASNYLPRLL